MDSIYLGCCMNIATYCDILSESFSGDKKKFMESHLKILKIASDLNSLYKPIIFAQLLITNFLLCMIGFQVVVLKNYYEFFLAASFGIAVVNQLFLYCFGGQLVLDKTASVTKNFFDLDKDLIIIIAKSTKGFRIKSVIYNADLPTFAAILGSAQGLITALKSFV